MIGTKENNFDLGRTAFLPLNKSEVMKSTDKTLNCRLFYSQFLHNIVAQL